MSERLVAYHVYQTRIQSICILRTAYASVRVAAGTVARSRTDTEATASIAAAKRVAVDTVARSLVETQAAASQ